MDCTALGRPDRGDKNARHGSNGGQSWGKVLRRREAGCADLMKAPAWCFVIGATAGPGRAIKN